MSYYIYAITPFFAWFVCGITKFILNCIIEKRLAFDLIGYGGMPSNHSAIVTSIVSLIGFKVGIDIPAFGVALTLAYIVILDASSLRKQIEKHAIGINRLNQLNNNSVILLRERIGHSKTEIFVGIAIGCLVGFVGSML
ncbi:divergent PAP2 family protein [Psychrobacter maritimus]|uniref:divergent PAP2 family protein n=1 Tax=Psychrobacter maritimus TaxID=256325 RepID=UPI0019195B8E|nr:divergent PAP2 family protein [Psychrobacter maritimus]